jgi:CBS-domain-containing membrane protein
MIDWFIRFIPSPISVSWSERIRSCVGALIGIAITGMITRSLTFKARHDVGRRLVAIYFYDTPIATNRLCVLETLLSCSPT